MNKRLQVFKCGICGNIVEILHSSVGTLVCCGKDMLFVEEKTADFKVEKHVPIIQKGKAGIKVVVGSTPHPMTEEHHIEWIEVINKDYVNRKYLKVGDDPYAEFYVPEQQGLILRSYCNLHGLWRG